ncbi:KAP family P-loop domain protein [Enhygromyxa salina]|uniref:KAP family P-loop domain protein n=1 Tax=Enhygromyxa salina TaxID=215803 RepID=A0A2S9YBJ3_9BACT|nr:P-loop NTPase fold protein [Enhygromyxa salina]PRQ02469.1 KAP family P-loop domain protein [Enhygromyxa salina]
MLLDVIETHQRTGFPDVPIDPTRGEDVDNRDLLGLEDHAAALAGFIKMCSTPMTIGIQGDWGSGKTSLMNLVRAKLDDGSTLNIWFNTWQYAQFGNEDQLASSMLVNLMQKVKIKGKPSKSVWHNASRFIRAVVQATKVSGGGAALEGKSMLDVLEGRSDLDEAGLFEQMKIDFATVIRDCLDQEREGVAHERVVIYIDDLDRLAPSKAVELLEAVKNLIDVEGCVFMLAIDYDVVIRGLRQRKDYATEDFRESEGKSFFDKIIQVPYRMPVERYTTQDFLRSHFERVYGALTDDAEGFFEDAAAELTELSVGNNPRGLKRALNIHSLFSHLIQIGREDDEVGDSERLVTFVLACVQVALPQMYSLLAKHEPPFRTLISLTMPEVYNLLERSDDSGDFRTIAYQLDARVDEVRGYEPTPAPEEEDDDDDGPADSLRSLISDLRRIVKASDTAMIKRIRGLAQIALQALDLDSDNIYSDYELEILDNALSVTSSTTLESGEAEQVETATPPTRRGVGFKELSETVPAFSGRPMLVFRDPVTGESDENFKRWPDYEADIKRLRLIVDGESVRIKAETQRVLELREQRALRAQTEAERNGRFNAKLYWLVDGDADARSVDALFHDWKAIQSAVVDTRSPKGRGAYDARVLACLRLHGGEYIPARVIEEQVGGSRTQLRASLNRLIERGEATYKGRARGTRYASI